MDELSKDTNYVSYFDDVLDEELQTPYQSTRNWTNHQPYPDERDNIVIFSSGWGDGLAADGSVVKLITDFDVLEFPDD